MSDCKDCLTCRFWAQYPGADSAKGSCEMIGCHETRVTSLPFVRKKGSFKWRPILKHDPLIPDDVEITCAMITPPDFSCDSWQPISTPGEDQ